MEFTMSAKASHFTAGEFTQISAQCYASSGGLVEVKDGGHFSSSSKTEIHTKEYHHHGGSVSDPFKELYNHIAAGCINDSAERFDAPRCHEETRKAVQEDVFSWIDRGPPKEILWLTGPAGTGKSAIMGTVSDKLKKKGTLVATFFFAEYAGTLERTSKRGVVTTLAYQLQRHPDWKERVSATMMNNIREDPAVFKMSLREQMEVLVLSPLRASQGKQGPISDLRHTIVIDGVDECREPQYDKPGRSRQMDQVEVLSILQQAIKDPAFPFRIVVASRPETWIRSFFSGVQACTVKEIFLDEKYSPDDDVRLFFKAKFAELCRRYSINPSSWPVESDIDQLVRDASGQFIYATTVLRFIDTPPCSPQEQLERVLKIEVKDRSNPFSVLDALYTSILLSSPNPSESVAWLYAIQVLSPDSSYSSKLLGHHSTSKGATVWTIDRLLESTPGRARMTLGLPSLLRISERWSLESDTFKYGESVVEDFPVGWNSTYTFYHKSFLDYLQDAQRCGAAFPEIDHSKVEVWIMERCAHTLKCGGPQISVQAKLLPIFQRCFFDILVRCVQEQAKPRRWRTFLQRQSSNVFDDTLLSECDPTLWLGISRELGDHTSEVTFRDAMGRFVHSNCHPPLLCKPGCRLWRSAIAADEKMARNRVPSSSQSGDIPEESN